MERKWVVPAGKKGGGYAIDRGYVIENGERLLEDPLHRELFAWISFTCGPICKRPRKTPEKKGHLISKRVYWEQVFASGAPLFSYLGKNMMPHPQINRFYRLHINFINWSPLITNLKGFLKSFFPRDIRERLNTSFLLFRIVLRRWVNFLRGVVISRSMDPNLE